MSNAIFTTSDYPLNHTFRQLVQTFYGVDAIPVNFTDAPQAVKFIQSYVQAATNGRVADFIHAGTETELACWLAGLQNWNRLDLFKFQMTSSTRKYS